MQILANSLSISIRFIAVVIVLLPQVSGAVESRAGRNDRTNAVAAMFSEAVLATNGQQRLQNIVDLPDEQRFGILQDWVLPNSSRQTLRLGGWIATSNGFAGTRESEPPGVSNFGTPRSVALELVRLAKQLEQLPQLRRQTEAWIAATAAQQSSQAALLALIANAQGTPQILTEQLERLARLAESTPDIQPQNRWPEIVVAAALQEHPAAQPLVRDILRALEPKCRLHQRRLEAVHILSLLGQLTMRSVNGTFDSRNQISKPLKHWHPVDRMTSVSQGTGRPQSQWQVDGKEVRCISNHECDFLYYQIPLQGNFVIEADVSSQPFARGHLSFGGYWVNVRTEDNLLTGQFRQGNDSHKLEPQLTKIDPWSRYRIQVQGNVISTWFNGRLLNRRTTFANPDPWLAIRNMWSQKTAVRNLRISGDIQIPNTVQLLTTEDLPGWSSYTNKVNWSQTESGPSAELTANRDSKFGKQGIAESLLSYHRPMLEDGIIRYEFFYRPGDIFVHPALDRTAFILNPNGIELHQVTTSGVSRDDLPPDNIASIPSEQLSTHLPLQPGEWNQLELSLAGDVATVRLNDISIYRHQLMESNRRAFGLFHFTNETAVRVRNIEWEGHWPKQLPPEEERELAEPQHDVLAGLDTLKEVMTHDFRLYGASRQRFKVEGESAATGLREGPTGVRLTPIADGSWRGITLALKEPVLGDFDAVLTFDELEMQSGAAGELDVELRGLDASGASLMASRHMTGGQNEFRAKMWERMGDGSWAGGSEIIADESTGGRIRLIRRGDRCHMLIAHQDSPHFRYCGSHQMYAADTAMKIEILAKCEGGGSTSVLLKELKIRSNTTTESQRRDLRITALEEHAFQLRNRKSYRLANADETTFLRTADVKRTEVGLVSQPENETSESTIRLNATLKKDFDVSVTVELAKLRTSGKVGFYFEPTSAKRIGLWVSRMENGLWVIQGDALTYTGEPARVQTNGKIGELRLIRIQNTVFLAYTLNGSCRLLGSQDVPDEAGNVLMVTVGKTETPTEVTWKSLRIRATLE